MVVMLWSLFQTIEPMLFTTTRLFDFYSYSCVRTPNASDQCHIPYFITARAFKNQEPVFVARLQYDARHRLRTPVSSWRAYSR